MKIGADLFVIFVVAFTEVFEGLLKCLTELEYPTVKFLILLGCEVSVFIVAVISKNCDDLLCSIEFLIACCVALVSTIVLGRVHIELLSIE